MKSRLILTTMHCLAALAIITVFGSCNNSDDVVEIFTGKTWKLTYIAVNGSYEQIDLWSGNETQRAESLSQLGVSNTYLLEFNGNEINGITEGDMQGRGISSTFSGTWSADGETRELNITIRISGSETDLLAKEFLNGLQNAKSYTGDSRNLFIYYEQGQTTRYMGFHVADD